MKQIELFSCRRTLFQPLLLFAIVLLLLFASGAGNRISAQDGEQMITGRVLDSETNQPIAGATVWLKETSTGRIADTDGNYTIPVEGENSILVFSHTGYDSKEERVGNRRRVVVGLAPSATSIGEVVVTALGGSQTKESVVGAISSVSPKDLKLPTAHVASALTGQVNGVTVIQRSGEPGAHAEFWIRGLSTLTSNNTPLVLVDGIERSIDHVDVDDIEALSVLKDAAATAVYGVRGANGVILIKTKTGEIGAPKITLNYYSGITQPTRLPKFVNSYQFADYYNEAYGYSNNGKKFYSDHAMEMYRTGADPDLYPNVDWIKTVFRDFAWNHRVGVNISGGGAIARYFISAGYYNEGSIFREDNMKDYNSSITFDKFNFRSNIDVSLTKTTTVTVSLSNIYETKVTPGGSDYWINAFEMSPNAMPVRFSDGSLATKSGLPAARSNPYNNMTQMGYRNYFWNTSQALVGLNQDLKFITKGLSAYARFSWDAHNVNQLNYINDPSTFIATGRDDEGNLLLTTGHIGTEKITYTKSTSGTRTSYIEASLNYNRDFGKHRVGGQFMFNQKSHRQLNADTSEGSVPYRNQGIAGRLLYSYDLRYFVEGNFGYNGSENFSPGKRFGFFPSVSAGWMISNEKFFSPARKVVDMLKIRGSYGVVGNDRIGGDRRFVYLSTFVGLADVYQFDGGMVNGIRVGHLANNQVSWETVNKMDVGIEISLLRMIKIEADYFQEHRTGIFLQRDDLSETAGIITTPWTNVGEVKNKGFDVSLEFNKKLSTDLSLQVRGNLSYNNNIVIKDAKPTWNYDYRDAKGRPVGQIFGLIAEGLYTSEEEIRNSPTYNDQVRVGDIKYRDLNGDGVITNFDRTAIGHSWLPKLTYSIGASLIWRNVDVSFLFQGVGQVSVMLGGPAMEPFSGSGGNSDVAGFFLDVYENRWTLDNPDPNAKYPRGSTAVNTNNNQESTYWLRDASYLRLKNATIGYTLPKSATDKMHIGSIRIYLSGVNLFTIDKIKLFDPEISGTQGAGYPPSRTVSVGLSVNF